MSQGWVVQAYGIPEGMPVILLHGFMQDATVWGPVAEALAATHYVAAPTIEPEAEGLASLEHLAEGVFGVVQQTMIHTHSAKVVLVGYSMGGRVALEYARTHPETLAGLVLESPSLGPETDEEREALRERNLRWADQVEQAESMEEVVCFWESEPLFATQRTLNPHVLEKQRKVRLRRNKDQLVWELREAGAHTMPPAGETRAWLAAWDVPVLYLAGDHDEKRVEEAARLDALGFRNIQTAHFACGHDIHLESPVAFAEKFAEFLKGTPWTGK